MENTKIAFTQASESIRLEIASTLKNTPVNLASMMAHLLESQGKNIRGTLAALTASDESQMVGLSAIKAAAAVEILHLASLIHDDIIDEADTRRGKPSLHAKFGKKDAVMAGDYLFCLCFSLISDAYAQSGSSEYIDHIADFSKAMSALCLGEIEQSRHHFDFDLTFKNYLKIIGGKTASLFAMSMYSGARAGGLDYQHAKIYGRIGGYFGIIFQLIDDCLDYEGETGVAQKPVGKDLREGIVTLPLIYALKKDPQIKTLFTIGIPDEALFTQMVIKVKALGGVDHTKALAYKYYLKTAKLIQRLDDPFKKQELTMMLDRIYDRKM
jgi:heptaprenyl diphosphate synthase